MCPCLTRRLLLRIGKKNTKEEEFVSFKEEGIQAQSTLVWILWSLFWIGLDFALYLQLVSWPSAGTAKSSFQQRVKLCTMGGAGGGQVQLKLGWSTFCVYLQQTGHFVHLELGCSYNVVHPQWIQNKHTGRLKMQNVTRQKYFNTKRCNRQLTTFSSTQARLQLTDIKFKGILHQKNSIP